MSNKINISKPNNSRNSPQRSTWHAVGPLSSVRYIAEPITELKIYMIHTCDANRYLEVFAKIYSVHQFRKFHINTPKVLWLLAYTHLVVSRRFFMLLFYWFYLLLLEKKVNNHELDKNLLLKSTKQYKLLTISSY